MTVMEKRLELDALLHGILGSDEVYFQPPESVKMRYPAIRYERSRIDNVYADNSVYIQKIPYLITVMYEDPDSELPILISKIPGCQHDRAYKSNNLNHDVFVLHY